MPETEVDAAPVTEDTATDETVAEEKPVTPEPQKYKLGEEEYDEPSLRKMVESAKKAEETLKRAKEIEKGGRSKFEEANALRRQFTQIKDIILDNPEGGFIEMAKIFGLPEETVDKMISNRANLQKKWETLSDDQKARYMAEQKLIQLEAEKAERERQDSEAKMSAETRAKQDAFEKKLAADTIPAMQEAGLHPTHLKLKLVAATLGAIADRNGPDEEPDLKEAIAYVAEAYHKDLDDSVKAMDPETFSRRYPEVAEKLRKYEVAKATGKPPGQVTPGRQPASRVEPQDKQTKKQSWSDFTKQMRALQKGERL